jgi:hypothetical protein
MLLIAAAGCARKGDPRPPEGYVAPEGPRVTAPSVVTDPIRRGRRL